jgi:hypothetical protein
MKAMNLLHREMRTVQYRRITMAIETVIVALVATGVIRSE